MPSCPLYAVTLARHPATRATAASGVSARIGRNAGGMLAVTYVIEGGLDRLRVPSRQEPSALSVGARLWEHTCCELYIARTGLPAYHEFNFSPSGAWAVHGFERYRDGRPLPGESNARAFEPHLSVKRGPARLELDAVIRLDCLSPAHPAARLSIALSAVLEESDGSLSYWALRHPPGRPDFHHADCFALELAATDCFAAPPSA
jgi:hypothetical protein